MADVDTCKCSEPSASRSHSVWRTKPEGVMTIEGKHLMHYSRHSIFVLQSAVSFKPTDALARTLEKNQEEEWQESWKARSHSKHVGVQGLGFAAAAQFIKEGAFV